MRIQIDIKADVCIPLKGDYVIAKGIKYIVASRTIDIDNKVAYIGVFEHKEIKQGI